MGPDRLTGDGNFGGPPRRSLSSGRPLPAASLVSNEMCRPVAIRAGVVAAARNRHWLDNGVADHDSVMRPTVALAIGLPGAARGRRGRAYGLPDS